MFGSFRKHQQWIWILGVIVIIPSFVMFFSPNAKFGGLGGLLGGGEPKPDLGSINGRPISLETYRPAKDEMRISYFMRTGGKEWPGNDAQTMHNLERDTISRIFLLERIKDLDIHVSDDAVARAARERLGDFPADKFEKEYLTPQRLTLEDFERYTRNET